MMRRLALSYWTPTLIGLLLLGLHLAWAIRWDPARRGEIATGFGACLIVLGLLVAARPYIRSGLHPLIAAGAGPRPASLPVMKPIRSFLPDHVERLVAQSRFASRIAHVTQDVWAERVIAVAVIAIGTLLNGYGPALVRLFGFEVSP